MIALRLDISNGDLFDNKYTIIKQIGSGSYGNVFLVSDLRQNLYALKLLRLWEVPGDLHDTLIYKFEQEFKASKISSEYLVHSFDFGTVQGNPYLVMEYCSRGDLSKILDNSDLDVTKYAWDILNGLYALHSEGKIHRDLKPENVLIRDNGTAALTDFGVIGEMDKSKRMSEQVGILKKRPKQMQGSPLYMAPEMVDRVGGGVTYLPTIDLWSFGVTIYEIITFGTFPFGNPHDINDLPDYQDNAKKGLWNRDAIKLAPNGDSWVPIIEKCLAPDYRSRYQTAKEIMYDMKRMFSVDHYEQMAFQQEVSRTPFISRLIVTQGENIGKSFNINSMLIKGKRMIKVGRVKGNDIVLPDMSTTYLSRYHFTMEKAFKGDFWLIRDGQWNATQRCWIPSTNGTYLNSTPVSSEGLRIFTGDIITAGEFKIKIE